MFVHPRHPFALRQPPGAAAQYLFADNMFRQANVFRPRRSLGTVCRGMGVRFTFEIKVRLTEMKVLIPRMSASLPFERDLSSE